MTDCDLMPELLEVETYRQTALGALGRTIVSVGADDAWYLKRGLDAKLVAEVLLRERFEHARRIGKLLLLDVSNGHVLGLRFGMTGRMLVDASNAIDELVYSSSRLAPEWNRFTVSFDDGGTMTLNDPRRLGGVELDPDESAMGVDATAITKAELKARLITSRVALKARLMDQSHVAGVGNLIADETLWRAGLDPARPANSLSDIEIAELRKQLLKTVKQLTKRGGSHTGDLFEHRKSDGVCPLDGTPLQKRTVGGRTTYSCPTHQV